MSSASESAPDPRFCPENDVCLALFLYSRCVNRSILQIAAECGFQSLAAHWQKCEQDGDHLLVRDAHQILPSGALSLLPGVLILKPEILAVSSSLLAAHETGRNLASGCDALWGHCNFDLKRDGDSSAGLGKREHRAQLQIAFGTVSFSAPALCLRLLSPLEVTQTKSDAQHTHHRRATRKIQNVFASQLQAIAAKELASGSMLLHRTIAPCAMVSYSTGEPAFVDPLGAPEYLAQPIAETGVLSAWLRLAYERVKRPAPIVIPRLDSAILAGKGALSVPDFVFPLLYETPQYIRTRKVPGASFAYLSEDLRPNRPLNSADSECELHSLLARRRSIDPSDTEATLNSLVETGVGRTAFVHGIQLQGSGEFLDFTALGVGLTPFSEGGFIEMGRTIDGKASMLRAFHRKNCAERLEQNSCRAGRVVGIVELPDEVIEMPDGMRVPAAVVIRAFRCALRIKQLDPIVCCLHSIQHTPLVSAFLMQRAKKISPPNLAGSDGLWDDESLARALEMQGASQASLRHLLSATRPSQRAGNWLSVLRKVRLEIIDEYAQILIDLAKTRLANELRIPRAAVSDSVYLEWFAISLGTQAKTWRRLRFLHDYHHSGVSRWRPEGLFAVGENNITLLAEFPDLDTSLFVDDEETYLTGTLQLSREDVRLLRAQYEEFHGREVYATELALRTLAMVLLRHDENAVEAIVQTFKAALVNDA